MLTADLVRATVRDGTLHLTAMKADARRDAVAIADEMITLAHAMVGEPIDAVREAFAGLERPHRLEKVVLGLEKLLLDATETEAPVALDPPDVRARVFERAAIARKANLDATGFDRDAVLGAVAAALETTPESIEQTLFADLKGERRLLEPPAMTGTGLVRAYEIGLEQAVLLRAERIVVEVRCSAPSAYRALFRRLKFLRLLCTVVSVPGGAYRLTIDGPYSLFESTTRYGFELAMLVPLLRECDRYELDAVVRWGAAKERVHFHAEGRMSERASAEPSFPEELKTLVDKFGAQFDDYSVGAADTLVELDGGQILVPDLAFVHRETGEVILLELLGYWSRAAVWKRVELAADPRMPAMVFAVPSRLRVSEEVLPDELPACLYTFKGTLRANAIHERLEQLRRVGDVAPPKSVTAPPVTAKPKRSRSRA